MKGPEVIVNVLVGVVVVVTAVVTNMPWTVVALSLACYVGGYLTATHRLASRQSKWWW